jgi:hypothetical protein
MDPSPINTKPINKMKYIFFLIIIFCIGSCKKETNNPNTMSNSSNSNSINPIVGTWTRYEFYKVEIQQNGTVCQNNGYNTDGIDITFNADGTYSGAAWGSGTWTYNSSTGEVNWTNLDPTPVKIYYNRQSIPWCSLTIPAGSQNPTLYFNYNLSLGAANGECQFYLYTQQRMRKN